MAAPDIRPPGFALTLNRRFAGRLAFAAFAVSHGFILAMMMVLGGLYGPSGAFLGEPGLLWLIEGCAISVTVLVALAALAISQMRQPVPVSSVILTVVAIVVVSRLGIAVAIGGVHEMWIVFAFSYALSWGVPEILAGVAAYFLHRGVFGRPGTATQPEAV